MMNLENEWIKAALQDLSTIKYIVKDDYLTSVSSFHSEQSVEKCFKAILIHKEKRFSKIHDIRRLHKSIKNEIPLTEKETQILMTLNELYTDSRYPGDMGLLPYGKPTLEDAKEFYEFALDIFDRVCKLLNIDPEEVKK